MGRATSKGNETKRKTKQPSDLPTYFPYIKDVQNDQCSHKHPIISCSCYITADEEYLSNAIILSKEEKKHSPLKSFNAFFLFISSVLLLLLILVQ